VSIAQPLRVTAAETESWVRTTAAGVGILAALGAALLKLWRLCAGRWRRRQEERRAIRYLVDAQHHVLRLLNYGCVPNDELRHQERLIRAVRSELARLDGHTELLTEEQERELQDLVRRTQRIEARKAVIRASQPDNPFSDEWTPEGK
jgi:hypothetical protein